VWVRWRRERDHVAIEVVDRGLGIAASERRAIFGKFVRGRAAAETHVKGTGVGLAMARHVARAHGGDVTVASEPGRGSTVTLRLPAPRGDGTAATVPARGEHGTAARGAQGPVNRGAQGPAARGAQGPATTRVN
jgi:K+-sensing histidine kinase KdpD